MVVQYDLSSRGAVDTAKANLTDVYGNAARLVRERDASLKAAYDDIANQVMANATSRQSADQAQAGREQGGMAAAARELGLTLPTPAQPRAGAYGAVDQARYMGNAQGWGAFLGSVRDIGADRNRAQADTFDHLGRQAAQDVEDNYASFLRSGSGWGRGGGGGGYEDEELVEYPKYVDQVSPGVARGLAATRLRLEKQAAGIKKSGNTGASYAAKLKAGLKKSGRDTKRLTSSKK